MLNKNNIRELAYVVKIDDIQPIPGRDRVECAVVGGWTVMVKKGNFKPGDAAIYFEIDSKVPEIAPFEFLAPKHYHIKTQKYKAGDGHFYSQGLVMSFMDLGLDPAQYMVGDFLTEKLGVTYYEVLDNARKAKSADKYKLMAQRMGKKAKNPIFKWFMKYNWGKKFMFLLFGKKSDKRTAFPAHVVKTDEERIQNLAHRIPEFAKERWIATEKVDGTSTTFSYMPDKRNKHKYWVCSRNVVMNQPGKDKTCYYAETDGNVYMEMSNKYDMENVLARIYDDYAENDDHEVSFITIQAETYGGSIQKRNYSIKEHDMAVFNVIIGYKDIGPVRLNPIEGEALMAQYDIPFVPVIGEVELPDTCEGILDIAAGVSAIDGLPREGLVFRSLDGSKSFKAVDNAFLCEFH